MSRAMTFTTFASRCRSRPREQRVAADHPPQPRPRVRPERDVDHARLVLEGQEDRAAGRHRVLASDDQAAEPDRARRRDRRARRSVTAPSRSSAGRNSDTTCWRASSERTA